MVRETPAPPQRSRSATGEIAGGAEPPARYNGSVTGRTLLVGDLARGWWENAKFLLADRKRAGGLRTARWRWSARALRPTSERGRDAGGARRRSGLPARAGHRRGA